MTTEEKIINILSSTHEGENYLISSKRPLEIDVRIPDEKSLGYTSEDIFTSVFKLRSKLPKVKAIKVVVSHELDFVQQTISLN